MTTDDPCPCGSGAAYDDCCGPLLATERLASTAEELMRSRYTAYFYGNREHLWRTCHPRTRPSDVTLDPSTSWTGLRILGVRDGGAGDDTGVVEFVASYNRGELRERSRFAKRGGRWFYLDAESDD
ncbi:YchJ family protein [Flexivirga lutea]